jgi:hypothetical protein
MEGRCYLFTVHLMNDPEAAGEFRSQLDVWTVQTEQHKHAKLYKDQLTGIRQDIGSQHGVHWFAEVWDSAGRVVTVAKLTVQNNGSIEISVVVKYPFIESGKGLEGPVAAIVAAALDLCSPGKFPTLTAAYFDLIQLYSEYGFQPLDLNIPQHVLKVMKPTNVAMKMTEKGADLIRQKCKKDVFWKYSLSWID